MSIKSKENTKKVKNIFSKSCRLKNYLLLEIMQQFVFHRKKLYLEAVSAKSVITQSQTLFSK